MGFKRQLFTIIIVVCMNVDLFESQQSFCNAGNYLKELVFTISGNNIVWPSRAVESRLIEKGKFYPGDMIPIRHLFYEDSVIIAFPKFKRGVPFSVAKMNVTDRDRCEPELFPYPSWADHDEENCDSISNAIDLFLDLNNMIWILDIGIENTLDEPVIRRTPKAFGIDAYVGKIKYVVPLDMLTVRCSRLQFIVADTAENKTVLYISDAATRSIIVYNVHTPKRFRVILPESVTEGSSQRHVLYLAMIREIWSEPYLYFTYLHGKEVFKAKSSHFSIGHIHGSIESVGFKTEKFIVLGTDSKRNLFLRLKGDNAIYVWNTTTELITRNFILVKRPEYERMATHIVMGYRKLIWMMESNFHDYISDNVGCLGPNARLLPLYTGT